MLLRSSAPVAEPFHHTCAPIPKATAHRLAVVIVSHNSRDLLDACLASVRAHAVVDGGEPEVWVVDNASSDGSAALVAERHPQVRLIKSHVNLGFSAANNLVLRRTSAQYVLALNPDCVLHPRTVPDLVALLDGHAEIGIAGCRLVRPDGTLDHAGRRSFPTIVGALGHFTTVGRSDRAPAVLTQYRAVDSDGSGPVDAVNGAFMLIRHQALEDVGLFDEGYWLYMEDLDLCFRFAQRDWTVWYEPSLTATHHKGASSGPHRAPRQNRAFHYGMYRFYKKFYAADRNLLVNLAVYAGIAGKLAISLTRNVVADMRERGLRKGP